MNPVTIGIPCFMPRNPDRFNTSQVKFANNKIKTDVQLIALEIPPDETDLLEDLSRIFGSESC